MGTRRTPLYNASLKAGARFQDWYGWELPRAYGGLLDEYAAAKQGAALHDSSYCGRIKATGEDVLDLLNRISTNEVISLQQGQGAPTILTTDRGRILDLITVHNLGEYILLLTSPQTRDEVIQWIDKYTIMEDVGLEDVTVDTAMLSILGPKAGAILATLVDTDLVDLAAYGWAHWTMAEADVQVIRRDLVGLPGFEVVTHERNAERVWNEISAAGGVPMGLEAYQVLRAEQGAPTYGRELGDAYNPLEAGLWGLISFTKGCYIGQEVIARLDTYQKVQKHLVRLTFSTDKNEDFHGLEGASLALEGKEVGAVTSVARVPSTGGLIGLGYVRNVAAEPGTSLSVAGDEGGHATVEAIALPFGPGQQT